MKQSDAMAPLRFIEIRSGNQHGEALTGEVSERVPKLAPRHGIHARRRFIEQQNVRLGNERAHQRQLLLHAAAQLRRQPLGEAVHVEHFQIAGAALVDFRGRNVPQFADVADVFGHAQVGIEAERLREVSGPRTRVARRPSENLRCAARRFHHSGENLKCGGFARAVGADQAEDFSALHLKGNSAHRFESAVAFLEAANINGGS